MKEYLKISSGDKLMYYPEFRLAELTIFPWYNDNYRIDIELATFDGEFNSQQKGSFETELGKEIDNKFSKISLRLECGIISTDDLESVQLNIIDGGSEDDGGLVQLCIDWVIYLRNITIEFKKVNDQLYVIWKGESEDIDSYSTPGLNTNYELVAKVRKVTELKNYSELLSHSKEIVKRSIRYRKIISKLKGENIQDLKLISIEPLDRKYEYNDSIYAWNKIDKTTESEELADPYK